MLTESFFLWDTEGENDSPKICYYKPEKKMSDWSVVIFAGGSYRYRAEHEGKDYADFLNENGITAFVVDYRVAPERFPAQLEDARQAMRFVRKNADKFGVTKDKIAAMGSSAGGHLTALLTNYTEKLPGEDDNTDFLPNAHILCYPVIRLTSDFGHPPSGENLFGEKYEEMAERFSVDSLVTENTPPAFIWHVLTDTSVSFLNSIAYVKAMHKNGRPAELHIFPEGTHGMGLSDKYDLPYYHNVAQWKSLFLNWLSWLDTER